MSKPQIPAVEVEKAEAIAGFAAGQQARAQGHSPAAVKALAMFGKSTFVGELELLPLGLQTQLCLMEHAKLYEGDESANDLRHGLKRLTRLAYCFALPAAAYETLTRPDIDESQRRHLFDQEAFDLAQHFQTAEAIDTLNHHMAVQMGILEEASPSLPKAEKKTPLRRTARARPSKR